MAQNLDLAAGDVGVGRAFRAVAHLACDAQHEFVAHRLGDPEHLGVVRIADDLRHPLAVAQVDENHPAVVAAAMRPAAQADGLIELVGVEQSAVMSSHGSVSKKVGAIHELPLQKKRAGAIRARAIHESPVRAAPVPAWPPPPSTRWCATPRPRSYPARWCPPCAHRNKSRSPDSAWSE